ncbi:hypothetical protein A9G11_10240 [Gilliamella sp. wkB108]|uniref:alpha/beta hydrolase-fold protein n=1 Tax=Gilliamella sp. wkB108 TaxID=3120256 RepID=UPI00080D9C27|nr:alpha/beta hydrolase-fold protein [Gilliamella apicola]OCG28598.1 hypothetical protein A9G11_10240 [Gilliamella apicola]
MIGKGSFGKIKQFCLYGVALLALPLCGNADQSCASLATGEMMTNQYLDESGSFCLQLYFNQGDLIQGKFDSLDNLDLYTIQHEHLRQLSGNGNEFLFTVPKSDNYQFVAKGKPKQPFELIWQSTPPGIPKAYTLISPELIKLEQSLSTNKDTSIFWQKIAKQGTPLIEPYDENNVIMTFLWRGQLQNIKIFGSPTGDHDDLYHLANSDVWFRSYIVPKTTRYSYQLAPNIPITAKPLSEQRRSIVATAQQDPLNPHFYPLNSSDKFHRQSYVELADAKVQFGIKPEASSPKGKLTEHRFNSHILNNERDITIYWPANSQALPPAELNLVILFDSKQYQQKTAIITIMDNLIAHKKIAPTIMVMIDTLDSETRSQELPPYSTKLADMLVTEFLPWLKQNHIEVKPNHTVIAGSSFGGLASSYIAFLYPQYFPNVLSLSGSFGWAPKNHTGEWLSEQFAQQSTKPIKFYLNAGLFEGNLLTSNRHFSNILRAKGYTFFYHETASGHDYLHWQGELAEGLQYLLNTDD